MSITIRQKIGTVIAVVAAVFLTIVCFKACSSKEKAKDKALSQYDKVLDKQIDMDGVKVWKDKYDNEHLRLEKIQIEKVVMEHYADSLASLLKIKPKQVQSVTNIKTQVELREKLVVDTVYIDSTKSYSTFKWSDKWMSIKGDIGKSDSIYISGVDTLTKTDYWKRKWFLGRKHYYTDISNQNPYIKLNGFKAVELKQKSTPRLGIGPYVGYDVLSKKPSVGISISYHLIRL